MEGLEKIGPLLAIVFIPLFIFIIVICVLQITGQWKIFKKAGKNGWEAIIPYYNTWTLIEISECKWWYFLILIGSSILSLDFNIELNNVSSSVNVLEGISSIANYFIMFNVNYNIAKKFNKDVGYAIGLTLLPFIFYPMLGLGKSEFNKNIKVSPYGAIKEGEK